MSADFADIGIVDLDLARTTWSRVHSSMRTLYLRLSREPDLAWVRFFHEERESRVVVKRHGLWIEDGCIVFDCLLEDVEAHHLPDFRLSIDYANRKCRELATTRREEQRQQVEDAQSEWQQLASLRAQIRGEARAESAASAKTPAAAPASAGGAAPAQQAASTQQPAPPPAAADAELEAKRSDLRARLRRALEHRIKESDRGND